MVEKMIRNTKIEIVIIIIFIILSIPLWQLLSKNLEENLANALEANTKLELILNHVDGYDNVIVNNAHNIEKNYQIVLITEKNCDNSSIVINNQEYLLNEFKKEKIKEGYAYILASDDILATRKGYKITSNLANNKIIYYYKLEELTVF